MIKFLPISLFGQLFRKPKELLPFDLLVAFIDLSGQVFELANLYLGFKDTYYVFEVCHVRLLLQDLVYIRSIRLALQCIRH